MVKVYKLEIQSPRLKKKIKDETGNRYGKLMVLRYAGTDPDTKYGGAMWLCRCDCGGTRIARGGQLRNGKLKTCGACQKGTGRLSNVLLYGEMAPCERGCTFWETCKESRLACRPFANWVKKGGQVHPDTDKYPPNTVIYRKLFSDDEQQIEGTIG